MEASPFHTHTHKNQKTHTMKAKAKSNTETKPQAITISKAFSKAVADAMAKDSALASATTLAKSAEINLATVTEAEYDDVKEARKALQLALTPYLESGRITESYFASKVSNVLAIAFPKAGEATRDAAIKAFEAGDLNIEQVKAASRGSLAPTKKGEWVPKKKKTRQGGSNKKSPVDHLKTQLVLLTSGKDFAKSCDAEQFATAICEIVTAIYPSAKETFANVVKTQLVD